MAESALEQEIIWGGSEVASGEAARPPDDPPFESRGYRAFLSVLGRWLSSA